uniref:Uncharacterized protein n=1 Tax=Panagrolaimus sp. PS1159 TaxID=55785 RepID=A0AC35F288_9BILA
MKGIFIISLCFIAFSLVNGGTIRTRRTIGQRLDATIDESQKNIEGIKNAAGETITHYGENVKEMGRTITSPVRYIANKTAEAFDSAGQRIKTVVSSTRHAAGEAVSNAGRTLHHAGESIKGSETLNQPTHPPQQQHHQQPAQPQQPYPQQAQTQPAYPQQPYPTYPPQQQAHPQPPHPQQAQAQTQPAYPQHPQPTYPPRPGTQQAQAQVTLPPLPALPAQNQ